MYVPKTKVQISSRIQNVALKSLMSLKETFSSTSSSSPSSSSRSISISYINIYQPACYLSDF